MRSYHPRHIHHHFLRNLHIPTAFFCIVIAAGVFSISTFLFASTVVNFRMIINPGTLAIDMVDQNFVPISQPSISLDSLYQSQNCQSTLGAFGTATQQIYVRNPDGADNGWVATISALSPETLWEGDEYTIDFNDTTGSGCLDGSDSDTVAGRMMVDLSQSTLRMGQCLYSCNGLHIMLGSSQYFSEGNVDSVTLLSASAESSDMGDWVLLGTKIIQTIPNNQPPSENYTLDLYLSIIAS